MKKLLFLLLAIKLFAFDVVFTKVYKQYVVPKKEAILIQTHDDTLTFPFKYIRVQNGYILIGDIDQINMWLDNEFYAPEDAKFKNIKIAVVDSDKIQYKIINKLKKTYKNCKIKEVIFLTPDETKIITKPQTIVEKYKIVLDCK